MDGPNGLTDSVPEVSDSRRTTHDTIPTMPVMESVAEMFYVIKGVLFTVVGLIAILSAIVIDTKVEQILGWLLVIGGVATLLLFLSTIGRSDSIAFFLLGVLHLVIGLWLLLDPDQGLTTLTFVLTGWFISHGLLKLYMAFQFRRLHARSTVLISGILSIALGIAIIILTPIYGLRLVCIILGVDLVSTGIAVLLMSIMEYCGKASYIESDTESNSAQKPLLDSDEHAIPS